MIDTLTCKPIIVSIYTFTYGFENYQDCILLRLWKTKIRQNHRQLLATTLLKVILTCCVCCIGGNSKYCIGKTVREDGKLNVWVLGLCCQSHKYLLFNKIIIQNTGTGQHI